MLTTIKYWAIAIVLCCFCACSRGPGVDMPFQAFVTIPAGLNTGFSHHFIVRDIPGLSIDNLIEAQPAYVTLSIDYGESNLDFIQQAYFEARDGSVRQEMAYLTENPLDNSATVQMFPSILDMKDHLTKEMFDMELKLIFRQIPVTETRIRIDFGAQGTLGE